MSDKRIYYFMLTFWGETYREYFYSLLLPTLLAPNNLPILRSRPGSKLVICTTQDDWDALKNRPLIKTLAEYVEPLILFIGYPQQSEGDQRGVNCMHMSKGHQLAAKRAYDDGAVAGFLAPDLLVSDGLIKKAVELIESGKTAVLCPALRFSMEEALSRLARGGFLRADQPMVLPALFTGSVAANSLHPEILRYEFKGRNFDNNPYWTFWRVLGRDGLILYTISWALLLGDYSKLPKYTDDTLNNNTIDAVYIWENFGHLAETDAIELITDTAQGTFLSLTPESEFFFPSSSLKLNWVQDWTGLSKLKKIFEINRVHVDLDPLRRWLHGVPVAIHGDKVDYLYRQQLRRAHAVMQTAFSYTPSKLDQRLPTQWHLRVIKFLWQLSLSIFRIYIRIYPLLRRLKIVRFSPHSYILAADHNIRKRRFNRALKYYAMILKNDPGDVATWSRSFMTRMSLRDFEGAMSDINTALSLAPNDMNLVEQHIEAARYLKMWDVAIDDCSLLIAREPYRPNLVAKMASLYCDKGKSLAEAGLSEQALDCYAIGLQKCPNDTGILSLRINLMMTLGDYAGAMMDANAAAEEAPTETGLIIQRGRVAQAMKQWALALSDYDQAISMESDPDVLRDIHKNREIVANIVSGAVTNLSRSSKI